MTTKTTGTAKERTLHSIRPTYFYVQEVTLSDGSKVYDVMIRALGENVKWFPADKQETAERLAEALNNAVDATLDE